MRAAGCPNGGVRTPRAISARSDTTADAVDPELAELPEPPRAERSATLALLAATALASLAMVAMGLYVINGHGSMQIGMLIAIATGALVGLLNGTLIAVLQLPPFIITLGMLGIAQGLGKAELRQQRLA